MSERQLLYLMSLLAFLAAGLCTALTFFGHWWCVFGVFFFAMASGAWAEASRRTPAEVDTP